MVPAAALFALLAAIGVTSAAPTCVKKTAGITTTTSSSTSSSSVIPSSSSASSAATILDIVLASSASSVSSAAATSTSAKISTSSAILTSTQVSSSSLASVSSSSAGVSISSVGDSTTSSSNAPSASSAVVSSITSASASSATVGSSASEAATTTAPSVTTSATSSASTATSSSKVGVSWPVQEVDAAPIAQFFTDASTVSWWYDWNKNWNEGILTSSGVTISGEFIPMLYDPDFYDNSDTMQSGWTEVMGYNEPDLDSSTGVSTFVKPSVAAASWKTQVTALRALNPSAKIHSPVMASNKTWLENFFADICPDDTASNAWGDCAYKPDYVSMHIYTTDATYFEGTVSDYYTTFGLPLVVSEWACYDFNTDPSPSASDVSAFMSATTGWMDQQDWIIKYAWFGAARSSDYLYGVAETNRLLDTSGAVTDLGKQYMAGGAA